MTYGCRPIILLLERVRYPSIKTLNTLNAKFSDEQGLGEILYEKGFSSFWQTWILLKGLIDISPVFLKS